MMDEMVRAALAKWPNVPDCYGWLSLDLRGQWRLGSERQTVTNAAMNTFIGRNYGSDESGRWLFQNGPQRVFVALDYTPWIWHLLPAQHAGEYVLENQVGHSADQPVAIWLDERGRFLIKADNMVGALHDHDAQIMLDLLKTKDGRPVDVERFAEVLEENTLDQQHITVGWSASLVLPLEPIQSGDVALRFRFNPQPKPD
jgi:hypothetical protein